MFTGSSGHQMWVQLMHYVHSKKQSCKHARLKLGAHSITYSLEMAETELPNTDWTRLINSKYLSWIRAQSVTSITNLNIFTQLCEICTDLPTWPSGSVNRLISRTIKKMPLKFLRDWKQILNPFRGTKGWQENREAAEVKKLKKQITNWGV